MRRPRKSARTGRTAGRRVQRRDERLPLRPAGRPPRPRPSEQLLKLVHHQDQARRPCGFGIARHARPAVRTSAGGGPDRQFDQHRGLIRRRRQRPVHRNRIRTRHLRQLRRQLPQRAGRGPDHPLRPPPRPRPQRTRRQPRHQPGPQQRRLAHPRLPGHQQDPRPVQPPGKPLYQLPSQRTATIENRRVPLLKRHQPQIRASRPYQAAARRPAASSSSPPTMTRYSPDAQARVRAAARA
jgi:hypothetical protein